MVWRVVVDARASDSGIIRTLDVPVYLTKLEKDTLWCLDREAKTRKIKIDATEALFKLALQNHNYSEVMRMVHHSRLCGQAIIAYLQQKGYPEVRVLFFLFSRADISLVGRITLRPRP